MVLSPEDMQSLSQAADEALAEAKATRAMAASLMASLHPTEQAAAAATRPARATVAAPSVKPAVAAAPAASKPTAATAAPRTINQSTAATPRTIKVSAGTAAPAAARAAPVPTVIPVLSPAPTATAAPASSKAPVSVKRATAQPRVPNVSTTLLRQALRQLPLRVAGIIGVVAVTAVAIANIAHHSNHSAPPVPVQTAATVPSIPEVVPTPTDKAAETIAQPDPAATAYTGQPVRVKNPFDHSEVFEFPAGTSLKEARQSMSQILMQRAQDRGVPAFHATRADRHTVARSKPARQQAAGLVQNSR